MSIRIAIADDHSILKASLVNLIHTFDKMEVVLQASNGIELLEKLKTSKIDVLLLDLKMPKMDGFEAYAHIKKDFPNLKTIVLSMYDDSETIKQMMKMGVQGYFSKTVKVEELEEAIRKVANHGFHFGKGISNLIQEVLESPEAYTQDNNSLFTKRELEILLLVAQGFKTKDIAEKLKISIKTVDTHKQNIQQKYGFKDVVSAVLYGVKMKLIDINSINFKN